MNNLSSPVIANMIRIYPKQSIDDTCLRLEIYGCQGKKEKPTMKKWLEESDIKRTKKKIIYEREKAFR